MKMRTPYTVIRRQQGTFEDLYKKAKTGSIITLGHYDYDEFRSAPTGFFTSRGSEFSFISMYGPTTSLGVHLHTDWDSYEEKIYLRHRKEFFVLTKDGVKHSLGVHNCVDWVAGDNGVYFLRKNHLYFLGLDGTAVDLGVHEFNKWVPAENGIAISEGFVDCCLIGNDGEKRKIHVIGFHLLEFGRHLMKGDEFFSIEDNGELRSLGVYMADRWGSGKNGVYFGHKEEVFFLRNNEELVRLGRHKFTDIAVSNLGLYAFYGGTISLIVIKQ